MNGTMMQYFHWYYPEEEPLWIKVKQEAGRLADFGINALWLPPAYKSTVGAVSNGYDVYDIYDLGQFDQKGAIRTKWGTKRQYNAAIKALHEAGIQAYADIVLNHMGGSDETERITVRRVNPDNRNEFISEPFEIEAHTKFTFPGRKGKYSKFTWDHKCFTGVDYAEDLKETGIFSILNEYGEGWEDVIDNEKGNYDYLMYCDIEFRNPAVREELKRWGKWYLKETRFDGVRLDAIKHMVPQFFNEWLDELRTIKPDLFAVGEYWTPHDLQQLLQYIEATGGRMSLFDAPLHQNFHDASKAGHEYDLTKIFDNTLVQANPARAVTLVDNHDTQPLQSLESPVEKWFRPLAHALILLREAGYPSIFYPDLYGAHYTDKGHDGNDHEIFLDPCENLDKLLCARKLFAYGLQRDYLDHPNCIGWTREGIDEQADSGCAILLSNSEDGFKSMEMGKRHAGKTFVDYLQKHPAEVTINEDGWGEFHVPGRTVSVWVEKR